MHYGWWLACSPAVSLLICQVATKSQETWPTQHYYTQRWTFPLQQIMLVTLQLVCFQSCKPALPLEYFYLHLKHVEYHCRGNTCNTGRRPEVKARLLQLPFSDQGLWLCDDAVSCSSSAQFSLDLVRFTHCWQPLYNLLLMNMEF